LRSLIPIGQLRRLNRTEELQKFLLQRDNFHSMYALDTGVTTFPLILSIGSYAKGSGAQDLRDYWLAISSDSERKNILALHLALTYCPCC
jgi:hypothetical protein